jgi:hypothetical protein
LFELPRRRILPDIDVDLVFILDRVEELNPVLRIMGKPRFEESVRHGCWNLDEEAVGRLALDCLGAA